MVAQDRDLASDNSFRAHAEVQPTVHHCQGVPSSGLSTIAVLHDEGMNDWIGNARICVAQIAMLTASGASTKALLRFGSFTHCIYTSQNFPGLNSEASSCISQVTFVGSAGSWWLEKRRLPWKRAGRCSCPAIGWIMAIAPPLEDRGELVRQHMTEKLSRRSSHRRVDQAIVH